MDNREGTPYCPRPDCGEELMNEDGRPVRQRLSSRYLHFFAFFLSSFQIDSYARRSIVSPSHARIENLVAAGTEKSVNSSNTLRLATMRSKNAPIVIKPSLPLR